MRGMRSMVTMTRVFKTFSKCFKSMFVNFYYDSFSYTKETISDS